MKKIIIQSLVVAVVIFSVGFIFYKTVESNANRHVKNNLEEAKEIYDSIPIWHKKIQTQQDLKIGLITDTHVHPKRIDRQDERDEAPRYLSEKQIKPITNFVSQMSKFQPEFIMHLGDIIEGTNDADFVGIQGLELVKKEISKVGVPIHWVIGNHDIRSVTKDQFKETLNLDSLNQVFDTGDYRFIILDANYNVENLPRTPTENRFIPGKLPPDVLEWFKKQLETDKRVFVFMHQGTFVDNSTGDDGPTKQSIVNATELHEILKEYRVDGIFNGHMEAKRFEQVGCTSFYSLTGTKKSKKYPDSYYELTFTDGKPDLKMFYATENSGDEIIEIDFENKQNVKIENKSIDSVSKNNDIDNNLIKIIKTPAKEGSGLERIDDQWIAIDDSGYIFKGDKEVYSSKKDLEGITLCNGKYFVAIERSKKIAVLNENFEHERDIKFKIGSGNTGAEGIACSEKGLYVVEQGGNSVYEIDLWGKLLDTFQVSHEDLSGVDYYDKTLYILSDKDDVIMVVKNKKVVDEIEIGKKGEWEGIKVIDGVFYIIEDDES